MNTGLGYITPYFWTITRNTDSPDVNIWSSWEALAGYGLIIIHEGIRAAGEVRMIIQME